jgi:hypothetical protein
MTDLAILDVAIGLAFIYALLALAASALLEAIETIVKRRSRILHLALIESLGAEGAERFYRHPMVACLYRGGYCGPQRQRNLPSYLPTGTFGSVVLDLVLSDPDSAARLANRSAQPTAASLEAHALAAMRSAEFQRSNASTELQRTFDGIMDRASGWFKRYTQGLLCIAAVAVTFLLNANTIDIAQHLYRNPSARRALVDQAAKAPYTYGDSTAKKSFQEIRADLDSLDIPLFAPDTLTPTQKAVYPLTHKPVGTILTILAIMLGAPFWFDTLNRLMVIRATVKPREKSSDEGLPGERAVGGGVVGNLRSRPATDLAVRADAGARDGGLNDRGSGELQSAQMRE